MIALVVMGACGGAKPDPAGPTSAAITALVPDAGVDAIDTVQIEADAEHTAMRRIRAEILVNPVGALKSLGVPEERFNDLARLIYNDWSRAFPEAARDQIARARAPAAAPVYVPPPPLPPPDPPAKWWCADDIGNGFCERTERECEDFRAAVGDFSTLCNGQTGWYRDACEKATATAKGISPCEPTDAAACYRVHRVLRDDEVLSCFPSIRKCKDARSYTLGHSKDDLRPTADCTPMR